MARTTRKVLEIALVSLDTIRPAVSNKWGTTKSYIKDTRAKALMFNPLVERVESAVANAERLISSKLISIREQQILAEVKYLERELYEAKKKLIASKSLKSFGVTSWKYLKVEAVPPMTVSFFNGPAGRKMEAFAGKLTNGFIGAMQNKIKEIDQEEERKKREMLAALKAREERLIAEAKKKEAERLKAIAKKAAEAS
uniref:Uncharacterized protein n=1 Tax=Heliothis virescens TaxID=7102 RepID=A0A2A4JJQ4_HELVI